MRALSAGPPAGGVKESSSTISQPWNRMSCRLAVTAGKSTTPRPISQNRIFTLFCCITILAGKLVCVPPNILEMHQDKSLMIGSDHLRRVGPAQFQVRDIRNQPYVLRVGSVQHAFPVPREFLPRSRNAGGSQRVMPESFAIFPNSFIFAPIDLISLAL